jgi:nucleoside-diphosphate-sugar epimerase
MPAATADVRITADLEPRPLNPYGVSKLVGERMGRDAAAQGMSRTRPTFFPAR